MESISDYKSKITKEPLLEIDGSILEGGGQIIRISISLSFLLNIPIKINNIRAKRDNPGLQKQHLTCTEFILKTFKNLHNLFVIFLSSLLAFKLLEGWLCTKTTLSLAVSSAVLRTSLAFIYVPEDEDEIDDVNENEEIVEDDYEEEEYWYSSSIFI